MLLVNPAQVKALQGRKSDQRDARRIAEFLQDERLCGSFVPPVEIRQLRILTRYRVSLLEQRNEVHNAIRDVLEMSGIKLSSVASDIMGVSGQRILRALAAGETSVERLSWKVRGRLRKKEEQVKESLKAECGEFARVLLGRHLSHYDYLTEQIVQMEAWIVRHLEPYRPQIALLATIPGVDDIVAWNLVAEMGVDMSVFPNAEHCASWAGLCPGTQESAGKQKNGKPKKGDRYLRRILTQSAWAISHKKDGYLRELFHRVKARRGWGKAIVAVAHKLVVIAFHMLRDMVPYRELGGDYFDRLNPEKAARRLVARLERLGYPVTLPAAVRPDPPTVDPGPVEPVEPPKRKRGRPRKSPVVGFVNPAPSIG
jgi:transposase